MKKAKSSGKKFMTGALLGAALGISAGLIAKSKFGKEMNKDLKKKAEDFYKHLAPHLGDAGQLLGLEPKKKVIKKKQTKK